MADDSNSASQENGGSNIISYPGSMNPDDFKAPDIPPPSSLTKSTKEISTTSSSSSSSSSSVLQNDDDELLTATDPSGSKVEVPNVFSPGERLNEAPVPYKEPAWGTIPPTDSGYKLEILKSGRIISSVDLCRKSFHVFGRANNSDVILEHPSISRHHAIIQFRSCDNDDDDGSGHQGMYIYDLGSTHLTFVNKTQIESMSYRRISVGHMIKFGKSTRTYILQGPVEDEEPESEMTITEMKQQKEMIKKLLLAKQLEKQQASGGSGDLEGISWGMADDAIEEDPIKNPSALTASWESFNIVDPKKTIRGFFEREGHELPEYEVEDKGRGSFLCRLQLPVEDIVNENVYAEALVSGKKKEAVLECAKDACRKLDAYGLLRQNPTARRKKRSRNWEDDDYYDSDDDNFLDRTGAVEKKRIQRMKNSGKMEETVDTYESLKEKLKQVNDEKSEIRLKLDQNPDGCGKKKGGGSEESDSLDSFMTEMKSQTSIDQIERRKLKIKILELQNETQRLQKLINRVKPTQLPDFKSKTSVQLSVGMKGLPMVGHMKGLGTKYKSSTSSANMPKPSASSNEKDENNIIEEEESSDEEKMENEDNRNKSGIDAKDEPEQIKNAGGSGEDSRVNVPVPSQLLDHESRKQVKMSFTKPKLLSSENTEWGGSDDKPVGGRSSVIRSTLMKGVQLQQKPSGAISSTGKYRKTAKPDEPVEDDDTYSSWMPPPGQSGDGKTHLNEKFGY